jgi:hypothetical protein
VSTVSIGQTSNGGNARPALGLYHPCRLYRGQVPLQYYIGGMSEIPLDKASGEVAAEELDAESEAEAKFDVESGAEAELAPEAEGEL